MAMTPSCRFMEDSYLKAALEPWWRRVFYGLGGLLLGLAAVVSATEDPGYHQYLSGDRAVMRQAQPTPGMVLMGGGNWDQSAMQWFLDRSGRGHILVLRASGGEELGDEMYRNFGGTASVETLVFTSRDAAFDPEVIGKVDAADGIFIAGGDQARYVRYWKGTPLARALDRHVEEGKPIGGTSAGLAILGGTSYGALDDGSISSNAALADPAGEAITLVEDFLHLPLMADIVTDTHFNRRHRLGRLIAFIARARMLGRPETIGLGIDEGGTLAVGKEGLARYYGPPGTYAWIVEPPPGVPKLREGQPLDWHGIKVRGVAPGGTVDMATMRVDAPGFSTIVSVHKGKLGPTASTGSTSRNTMVPAENEAGHAARP